jgi:D-alanyl-D-alanine dipeptidase
MVLLNVNLILISLSFISNHTLPENFAYLNETVPDIEVDLRYFSSDNFVGDTIDGYHEKKCIISSEGAKALVNVQNELNSMGYGLKVFDAYRPQHAVDHFVRWAKDLNDIKMKHVYYPEIEKRHLFEQGYISSKSGHTRGKTVDLTIVHLIGANKGKELDMGTPWDFFSPLSWPTSNEVTALQKSNRMLLQRVMEKYGFKPYKEEWWHFTLKDEPYPDTYFDFPVK